MISLSSSCSFQSKLHILWIPGFGLPRRSQLFPNACASIFLCRARHVLPSMQTCVCESASKIMWASSLAPLRPAEREALWICKKGRDFFLLYWKSLTVRPILWRFPTRAPALWALQWGGLAPHWYLCVWTVTLPSVQSNTQHTKQYICAVCWGLPVCFGLKPRWEAPPFLLHCLLPSVRLCFSYKSKPCCSRFHLVCW